MATATTPLPPPAQSPFSGPKIMLIGPQGTGKTTALKTLLAIPEIKNIMAVFTEPRYDVLSREVLDRINWVYLSPVPKEFKSGQNSWGVLQTMATRINSMSNEALQTGKMEATSFQQWMQLVGLMNNFTDSRGRKHGDAQTWGTDTVLWLDSWTGITKMGTSLQVGAKPILSQPDYGVVMRNLELFLDTILTTCTCSVVITGHLELEPTSDGSSKFTISTIGKKLAPVMGLNFSDIIRTRKNGSSFVWDTADGSTDLKACNIGIGAALPADFKPLFTKWQQKGGVYTPLPGVAG